MTRLAVMARVKVTPGADQWVPISGVTRRRLTGQVTSPVHVPKGAARSEPHRHPGRTACTAGTGTPYGKVRVVPGGVPGVQVVRVGPGGAQHTSVDECIYGALLPLSQARAGARTVPEQC